MLQSAPIQLGAMRKNIARSGTTTKKYCHLKSGQYMLPEHGSYKKRRLMVSQVKQLPNLIQQRRAIRWYPTIKRRQRHHWHLHHLWRCGFNSHHYNHTNVWIQPEESPHNSSHHTQYRQHQLMQWNQIVHKRISTPTTTNSSVRRVISPQRTLNFRSMLDTSNAVVSFAGRQHRYHTRSTLALVLFRQHNTNTKYDVDKLWKCKHKMKVVPTRPWHPFTLEILSSQSLSSPPPPTH